MRDSFHQFPLKKENRHITCMSTLKGTKNWTVLVMVLKNAGAIFQRMMEYLLQDFDCFDVYIDDVIIGSTGADMAECAMNHERDV